MSDRKVNSLTYWTDPTPPHKLSIQMLKCWWPPIWTWTIWLNNGFFLFKCIHYIVGYAKYYKIKQFVVSHIYIKHFLNQMLILSDSERELRWNPLHPYVKEWTFLSEVEDVTSPLDAHIHSTLSAPHHGVIQLVLTYT